MFKRISPAEAKALLEQGNASVADIRDPMSFNTGRIRNAVRVDNSNLQSFMETAAKDKPLIVCCYHGNSSQGAAQFFADQGYSEAYSLDGGFEMWKMIEPGFCEQ